MAHIIKRQPHSLSAAFQECLKPAIIGFQPLMRPLLFSHLPKGTLSQACVRLRGCRHHATLGTAEAKDALNCSPPKADPCARPLAPSPCLPAFPCAHPHVNALSYFQSHDCASLCIFSTTRTQAHVRAESNSRVLPHPPAFPLASPRAFALLSLRCSAALAHVPSWYSPVLTALSRSPSLNAQPYNPAVIGSVSCQTHICSQVVQNKTGVYQG